MSDTVELLVRSVKIGSQSVQERERERLRLVTYHSPPTVLSTVRSSFFILIEPARCLCLPYLVVTSAEEDRVMVTNE